jgi:hypothetical protein
MEKRNKKGLVVFGLLVLCVILATGIFMFNQTPKGEDVPQGIGGIAQDVTPGGIAGTQTETPAEEAAPTIVPNEINPTDTAPIIVIPSGITPAETTADSGTDRVTPMTTIPEKPDPPELPETAYKFEPAEEATLEDVEAFESIPAELRNPDVRPNITPAPVTPAPSANTQTPQSGDRQNGQVYIPGFGWIKDEGGGSQGSVSDSNGSLDKIIGY